MQALAQIFNTAVQVCIYTCVCIRTHTPTHTQLYIYACCLWEKWLTWSENFHPPKSGLWWIRFWLSFTISLKTDLNARNLCCEKGKMLSMWHNIVLLQKGHWGWEREQTPNQPALLHQQTLPHSANKIGLMFQKMQTEASRNLYREMKCAGWLVFLKLIFSVYGRAKAAGQLERSCVCMLGYPVPFAVGSTCQVSS